MTRHKSTKKPAPDRDRAREAEAEDENEGREVVPYEEQVVRAHEYDIVGCHIPIRYELWADGTYIWRKGMGPSPDDRPSIEDEIPSEQERRCERLSSRPIWIRRFGQEIRTKEDLVELGFLDLRTSNVRYLWVTRTEISESNQLMKLISRGIGVTTVTVSKLVSYLDALIAKNASRLPWVDVSRRTGFIMTEKGFGYLLGQHWIGPDGTSIIFDPTVEIDAVSAMAVRGQKLEWLEKFDEITKVTPLTRWLACQSFVAPLLQFIGRRSFFVHHWGQSRAGKTAQAKFASSAWGDPNRLTESFNRTEMSFTETFQHRNDLPVTFDELQASTIKDYGRFIYHVALEQGRVRVKTSGGVQSGSVDGWHTVVRTTGEEPITGVGQVDRGGQANRVIQLSDDNDISYDWGSLHRWCNEGHHGWGALLFLKGLVTLIGSEKGVDTIRDLFRTFYEAFLSSASSLLGDQVANVAACATAETLAFHWIKGMPLEEATTIAAHDAHIILRMCHEDVVQSPDQTEVALQKIRDHIDNNGKSWADISNSSQLELLRTRRWDKLFGILHGERKEVWVIQTEINMVLSKAGLSPRAVWKALDKKGCLSATKKPSYAVNRTIGAFRNKVYALKWDVVFTQEMTVPEVDMSVIRTLDFGQVDPSLDVEYPGLGASEDE